MRKVKKKYHNFYLLLATIERLRVFCEESGMWNMSVFADIAIQDKLKKEEKLKRELNEKI